MLNINIKYYQLDWIIIVSKYGGGSVKIRQIFGIICFITVLLSSGCTSTGQSANPGADSLAISSGKTLKINRAGNLEDKPVISGTGKTNNAASKTNTQLQAQAEIQKTTFKAGDKGKQVVEIQKKINKFGYSITADGDYGEETEYIVMDFQFRHNLEINGIISGKTLELLNKTPNKDTIYKAQAQAVINTNTSEAGTYENEVNNEDCPSYSNYLIMVNLSKQQVYIFNGSAHSWKLINTFSCASGKDATPTIKGKFYLGDKGTQFTPGNGVYCKYYSQISGNYLFHSILYDAKGDVIDSTLGETASHGCIRLALENAKYIYENVPIGSGIWIY